MTLEQLAVQMNNGFRAINKRFDGVDERFDGIDNRLNSMDGRLDSMDCRLGRLEILHEDTQGKIQALVDGHAIHVEHLERIDAKLERLDAIELNTQVLVSVVRDHADDIAWLKSRVV